MARGRLWTWRQVAESFSSTKPQSLQDGPVQVAGGLGPFHASANPRILRPTSRITIVPKTPVSVKTQRVIRSRGGCPKVGGLPGAQWPISAALRLALMR